MAGIRAVNRYARASTFRDGEAGRGSGAREVTLKQWSRRLFIEKAVAGTSSAVAFAYRSHSPAVAASQAASSSASNDLASLDLQEAATLLRQKKVSPVELTRACLSRIEALNPVLNAFITVTAESALAQARVAEGELQRGMFRGPLHGIPVALKDLGDTAGVRTTAGARSSRITSPAKMPPLCSGFVTQEPSSWAS
jgi:hypothetical protein